MMFVGGSCVDVRRIIHTIPTVGNLRGGCFSFPPKPLGCDFFERIGEKRIDIRRFLGYVCHIAKVRVRMSFGWVSLFAQKFVFFYFFVRMRI